MGSKKDTFKKQFQTNKTNTVKRSDKKYNKQTSKSDKEYISGNYVSSVDKKIFGIKNSLAEGKKVNGYGDDYVDTKGMKRSRYLKKQQGENPYDVKYKYTGKKKTVKGGINSKGEKYDSYTTRKEKLTKYEKESFKNTGTLNDKEYMPKQKYAILSSHKWDNAEKFNDHFNTGVADGYETAKANQRKGKHVSNAIEYLKGGVKDILIDPAADFMKGVGAISSYGLAGVAGAKRDLDNSISALTDTKRTLKDYTGGKSAIVENIKENKKSLDKTGFGLGFGDYFNSDKKRADKIIEQEFRDKGKLDKLDKFKKFNKDNEKLIQNSLNVAGFAADIVAPSPIEDKVVDVMKGLGKNTVKSFKQLKNGTANLATGIVPEETAKLMANSKKYAGKGSKVTNASDDVFYSGKKGNTSIDRKLDNEFNKTVDRIKDTVKQNPNTKNIGKFLDTLDEKPLKGTQRNIDGRTLNKKHTQTKDGYKPQLMRSVDEVDDAAKEFAQSQQFSMFGKDGSTEGYLKQLKDPYARYENILKKYDGDIDGLAEKLDSMKPQNAKEMYDYLMKRKSNLYKELTKGSDDVTNLMLKNDKYSLKNIPDELPSIDKIKELNKGYNQLNERRFLESVNGKQEKIGARLKVSKGKQVFKDGVGKYLFGTLPNKSVEELEHVSGLFNNMIKMVDNNEQTHVIAKQLNALLFDGQDVIRNNMPRSSMKDMLEYFDDIVEYQKAVSNGEMSVKFRSRDLPKEYNIYAKDGNMNLTKDIDFSAKFSPSAVDTAFESKRQDIASKLGVKYKTDITKPYDEYLARKMNGEVLTEQEYRHFKDLESRKKVWDDLYQQVKDLNPNEYEEFARKNLGINKGYKEALDELADSGKNKRLSYEEFVAQQNTSKTALDKTLNAKEWKKEVNKRWKEYNLDIDGAVDGRNLELVRGEKMRNQLRENSSSIKNDNIGQNSRARQEMLEDADEWEQMTKGNTTGNIKDIPFKQYKQNYSKDLGLNYVNTKYPIQIRKEKQTLQGVRSYKPVDTAISNLEKLMNKEVALTIKGNVNSREYETLRALVKDNVKILNDLGVDNNVYFNHIKQLKMNLLKDGQVSANTRGIKPMSGKVKNTTKGINLLEMAHIKINGKALDNIEELTPDQLQWKYLMTEGAKTIDELFDAMPGSIPQRGDNLGNEIANSLRPNKTNTPLDNIVNKTDDYVDDFERVIEQENIKHSEELRERLGQNSNTPKKRAEIDPRTEERLKYYESKLNLPEPKTLDELDFNIPGVDEDGVIQDLTKTFNNKSDNTPTFEQFKETVSKNSNGKLPYEDSKIYDVYKRWLNSYKKGLTVYNPGWHIQNFFQNKGQNFLALGADAFVPQTEAKNIIRKMNGRNYKDVNVFDSKNKINYSMDDITKLAQELGVVDGLGEDVRSARGIFSPLETRIDNSGFMKRLGEVEETARMHHFVKQLEKGMSPEQASKSVNKYLFDYSDKSKFDKVMGDFVDPFWMFHKNNAKLMYGSMLEHPGKINSIIKGTNGLENGVPEEQRQNENSKYGKIQKPYANFTDDVNNDQYNYLYKQNMFPDVEDAIPFEGDALENKMNPILRMLLQQSRGEGNFGNEIVEGDEAGWNEITKKQRAKEVLMDLNPFMPNAVKTMDSILERQQKVDDGKQSQETSDKQILMDFINYITGNKGNWYRNIDF